MKKVLLIAYCECDRNEFIQSFLEKNYSLKMLKTTRGHNRVSAWIMKNAQVLFHIPQNDVIYFGAMNHGKPAWYFWCKLFRKKVITDFYVSRYDTIVRDRGLVKPGTLKAAMIKQTDRIAIDLSNAISYLSLTEKLYYEHLLHISKQQIYVVVPLVKPCYGTAKFPYYSGESGQFNVAYWGSCIPLHGLEYVIQAWKIVTQYSSNVKLHIYSPMNENMQKLQILIDSLGMKDMIEVDTKSRFDNGKGRLTEKLLNETDLALGAFGTSEKAKTLYCNKVVEAVGLKLPLITGESKAIREYFGSGDSIFVTECNPDAIAKAILSISKCTKEEMEHRVDLAYQVYCNEYSVEAYEEKMCQLLDSISAD